MKMSKNVDVRCYVSPEMKYKIKRTALDKNTSVNKLLHEILCREFQEQIQHETALTLNQELETVLSRLSNSANMSADEREALKKRKNEIKAMLQKGEYGNKPLTENNCNDGLRRILSYYNKSVRKKELKIRGFTCHKFRHTFATTCEVKDVSERAKKALLGHLPEKDDVTNRYIHPPFEYVKEQAQKLNEP